jgi:hypothetical protein
LNLSNWDVDPPTTPVKNVVEGILVLEENWGEKERVEDEE